MFKTVKKSLPKEGGEYSMLDSIRKKASIIIIVVVIAFALTIVLDWGMNVLGIRSQGEMQPVGKINDQEITYQTYHNAIQKVYMEYKNQVQDKEITEQEMENIREQAWNNLINEYIFADIIKENDIRVSDNELVQFIKFSPPQEVRQIEQFQTDGKFDFQKYLSFIQSPQSAQFIQQMEYVFRGSLPQDKIYYRFFTTVNTTDEEIRQYYHLKNDKVQVKYLKYGTDKISNDEINISDDEIQKYYTDNKENYKKAEQVDLAVYKIFKRATPSDIMNAQKRIQEIYGMLQKNEQTFEEVARYYSEDKVTADKGGDLGFLSQNTFRIKELEEKAFALEEGQVTEPLKNKNRWYIFKCEEKRKNDENEEIHLRQIVVKEEASEETIDSLNNYMKNIVDEIHQNKYSVAVAEEKLNIKFLEAGKVNRNHNGFIPQVGILQGASMFIGSAKKGDISKRFYENEQGYYILAANEIEKESYKPLDQVQESIKLVLTNKKKLAILENRMNGLKANVSNASNLSEIDGNTPVDSTTLFGRMDFIPNVGRNNTFVAKSFQTEINSITGPFQSENAFYIIQVTDKVVASDEEYLANKEKVEQEYAQYLKNIRFQNWFMSIRDQYEIVDNRSVYFY